jgi:pimeloyl-ACP methyl ester carboxylesterase/predicted ester cyclase
MATRNAAPSASVPAQITVAGMAADLYGSADERPPLVLLHGLTFDRRIWRPVLVHLARLDPGRQILSLDLPGHGESPSQLPHSAQHTVGLIHQAVEEAGLAAPVVVGHSIAGGFASVYAGQHPVRGVVNLDALPDPAVLRQLRSAAEQIRGDGFPGVWAMMEQSFGTDLLPPPARVLVTKNSRPRQDLVVSYWDELLGQTAEQADEMLTGAVAAVAAADVPYLLILGAEPDPGLTKPFTDALPGMTTEVWAGTGHFPHLAHPARFARRLAATAQWQRGSLTPADMDKIIDAHFEAERRGDIAAILATVSDDISHEVLGTGLDRLEGKDAVGAFYKQLSQDLTIGSYTTIRRIHGPGHAWEEGMVHATAAGKAFGLDGRDRRVVYRLNHLFEFSQGLIRRELGIPDVASILAQLSQPE